jgi:hypothetical protein
VVIEMEDRVPVGMLESVFFLTHFNPEGGMDQDKKVERQRLAIGMRGSRREGRPGRCVIDMRPRLLQRQHDHEFRWNPTQEEAAHYERRIAEILGLMR